MQCDYCSEEPIKGTRWHCTHCRASVDYCSDCLLTQLQSDQRHPLTHKFVALRVTKVNPSQAPSRNHTDDESDDGTAAGTPQHDFMEENSKMSSDEPMSTGNFYTDKDYLQNDHNYLDPNFLPE